MRKKDLDYLKNDDIDIGTHINNMRLCLLLELFIFIITVVLLLTYLSWFETYFWKNLIKFRKVDVLGKIILGLFNRLSTVCCI